MSIVLRSFFYNVFISNFLKSYVAFSNNLTCVVPESIHNPPPNRRDWKFQVVGGLPQWIFFSRLVSVFIQLYVWQHTYWWCVSHTIQQFFWGKKMVRIKIWYLAFKFYSLFLVSTMNDNIFRECATKMEFPEGRGVVHSVSWFWKI